MAGFCVRSFLKLTVVTGAISLVLLGSAAVAAEMVKGGSFKILINRDIDGFDSTKVPSPDLARMQVLFAAHELLFRYHPETDQLEPRLGLTVVSADDFKTWVVTLRQGVKF